MPSLADVLALFEEWYPARWADDWDAVGLVCGDPSQPVERILLAVDPVREVVAEATAYDADLLVTHHPLFLTATHSVAATTPKGRVVHELVTHGCALFTAHTNADAPVDGVSEAIALALGLEDVRPLQPAVTEPLDKVVVYVPSEYAERMRVALSGAGAGRIGDYEAASFTTTGEGRFRPTAGANPTIGTVGDWEVVPEARVEVVVPQRGTSDVVAAMMAAHPYEEPAYDVLRMVATDEPARGSGRIGRLREPITLEAFGALVGQRLRPSAHGIRVSGSPDQLVSTVALCGGSGDFLLDAVLGTDADVYLTSDLRHHRASEFREQAGPDGPGLVDVAHWSAEWAWLPVLQRKLVDALVTASGATVDVRVSTTVTDPWTFRTKETP